ncbi:MAG TPA: heparinase II/III family protein [Candidatus Brocadiia bacterium]|nr:heparinase II/III family protein [Candidatus Brocadiia bacterium]
MTAICVALILAAAPVKHPVYPPQFRADQVEWLKSNVAIAMGLTPKQLGDMVPGASGIFFCGCPNCDGGSQENNIFDWEPGIGDGVKCRFCGMQFPNEKFPYNREKVIIAPGGARQVYRWHEDKDGRQYFIEANAWYKRWSWIQTMALQLANLYALTGDSQYGDRAAAIVGRFAQVYPDYAIRFDYPFQPVKFWPANQKWPYEGCSPYRGAKFYWWAYGDVPGTLARAYDLVAPGDSFERMKDLLGENARERIERDLFRMGYEFAAANPDTYTNMSPCMYDDMIVVGRVIGAPDIIREVADRLGRLGRQRFFFDGWWMECAPSYHWQTAGAMRNVIELARGYSDPPDSPEPRFENLDLEAEIPIVRKAFEVGYQGCLPDGREMPVNDTWWHSRRRPLDESTTRLWSGMGHAILGAGKGEYQFQTHMNWNAGYGHTHMDSGSIILFAHGRELLSDIGYTHTRYRNWTVNSASHNMVVIDQRSQILPHGDPKTTGNVNFFDDSHSRVTVIDLDARPAYPGCKVYRRRLIHIHVDEGRDYLADVFDVEGGDVHDWFLHGSADDEGAMETSIEFAGKVETLVPDWGGRRECSGENCVDFEGKTYHSYGFLRDIRAADSAGPLSVVWRYDGSALRTFAFPEPGTRLFRFKSPAIRKAGSDDAKLNDHLMNGVMQRTTGGRSRFAALHVPFKSDEWIKGVSYSDGAFTVKREGGSETIRLSDEAVTIESSSGWRYDSGKRIDGIVMSVDRSSGFAFVADCPVPAAKLVRLDFGGARLVFYRVAKCEGPRFTLLDDPGFEYENGGATAKFVYHPHEELPAPIKWTVWTGGD